MGFELIERSHTTPHRLYAMVKLIDVLGTPSRNLLLNLLQPPILNDTSKSRETAERLYIAASRCNLARDTDKCVELNVDRESVRNFDAFRLHIQKTILGVTEQNKDHYILNLLAAWYAVQDEQVLSLTKGEINRQFQEQLFSTSSHPVLNENPGLTLWFTWAEFVGWGWPIPFNKFSGLVPDATVRLRPLLQQLLPKDDQDVIFTAFMNSLSQLCPELDGGILFNQAWEASRGNEQRGNRLSLMLSTALRVLHKQGELELIQRADATDSWRLFPTQSYINQVTHIRRKAVA